MAHTCNFALVGHGSSGKTTLAEAVLAAVGVIPRAGSVGQGTTTSDFDEEEQHRRISIATSVLTFEVPAELAGGLGEVTVNLLDAPGYPDFIGEAVSALSAVETALVAVSAPAGVELEAARAFERAAEAGLARALVITKMDAENVRFEELLQEVRERFGSACVPFTLPVDEGSGFSGVVPLWGPRGEVPEGVLGDPEAGRREIVETALEADEALMEKYLSDAELTEEELTAVVRRAVATGVLVPVLVTAAERDGLGVAEMLRLLLAVAPGAEDWALSVEGEEIRRRPASEVQAPVPGFVAQVFKVVSDPFVGKLCYLRVWSGQAQGSTPLTVVRREDEQLEKRSVGKAGQFLRLLGAEQTSVSAAGAGDIVAVAKMEELRLSDTVTDGGVRAALAALGFPTPMVSLAVEPESQGDEDRVSSALARLAEEDATFRVSRDRETGELVVTGVSDLHLGVCLGRMKRRFKVSVKTAPPKIPYRETITAAAEAHYRHKKQTGGRGQFGEVDIKLEPMERGEGFEFVNEIFGGAIPHQFIPAVEKGVVETMASGVLAGYPVVDVRVRLDDGSYHTVDSSEAAFKLAASRAFQEGFMQAKPVLLEPIVTLETTVPSQFMGEVVSDLNARRGRILGADAVGSLQVVRARVPLAELVTYSSELRSMTGGQGSYRLEASHYDIVPQRLAAEIIERAKKARQER